MDQRTLVEIAVVSVILAIWFAVRYFKLKYILVQLSNQLKNLAEKAMQNGNAEPKGK